MEEKIKKVSSSCCKRKLVGVRVEWESLLLLHLGWSGIDEELSHSLCKSGDFEAVAEQTSERHHAKYLGRYVCRRGVTVLTSILLLATFGSQVSLSLLSARKLGLSLSGLKLWKCTTACILDLCMNLYNTHNVCTSTLASHKKRFRHR